MIVAVENVRRDRDSFDWWWPQHLASLAPLVDKMCIRVDASSHDAVHDILTSANGDKPPADIFPQFDRYGRFQEDVERQELLRWAVEQGADWVVCFDADEVIEPGGGEALRTYLTSQAAGATRLVRVILSYSSHHRPGYILPRGAFMPWRAFRLDRYSRNYRYKADRDGLHCGSVPAPGINSITCPDLRVIHYHATTCAEYMAEREFYDQTIEVHRHGGINFLYACNRFGDEALAVSLEQELSGAEERLARVAAGQGFTR